jgi:hypothetical protein
LEEPKAPQEKEFWLAGKSTIVASAIVEDSPAEASAEDTQEEKEFLGMELEGPPMLWPVVITSPGRISVRGTPVSDWKPALRAHQETFVEGSTLAEKEKIEGQESPCDSSPSLHLREDSSESGKTAVLEDCFADDGEEWKWWVHDFIDWAPSLPDLCLPDLVSAGANQTGGAVFESVDEFKAAYELKWWEACAAEDASAAEPATLSPLGTGDVVFKEKDFRCEGKSFRTFGDGPALDRKSVV